MSVLDELKTLDEQRTMLLEGAKAEALQRAEKAIADLNELGFHYSLNDESGRQQQSSKDGGDIGKTSVVRQLKALDKQRAELYEGAKAEALEMAQQAISLLDELGFPFKLVENSVNLTSDRILEAVGEERQGKAESAVSVNDGGRTNSQDSFTKSELISPTHKSDEELRESNTDAVLLDGQIAARLSHKGGEQSKPTHATIFPSYFKR